MEDYRGTGNIREKAGEEGRKEEGDKSFIFVCVAYVRVHVCMCVQQSLYANVYRRWSSPLVSSSIDL